MAGDEENMLSIISFVYLDRVVIVNWAHRIHWVS